MGVSTVSDDDTWINSSQLKPNMGDTLFTVLSSSPVPSPVFVSMYEIENFAYMFFLEKGLESPRSNPVSHVSVYMYVCMEVGEGVCLWGEGRGVSVG